MEIEIGILRKIHNVQIQKQCSAQCVHNAIARGALDSVCIEGTHFVIANHKLDIYCARKYKTKTK